MGLREIMVDLSADVRAVVRAVGMRWWEQSPRASMGAGAPDDYGSRPRCGAVFNAV